MSDDTGAGIRATSALPALAVLRCDTRGTVSHCAAGRRKHHRGRTTAMNHRRTPMEGR